MEKIVTHPLYIRCKKVIESCKTKEQRKMAINYCNLAKKRTSIKLANDFGNIRDYLDHYYVWDECVREAEWN